MKSLTESITLFVTYIIIIAIAVLISMGCWHYTLITWLSYFGKPTINIGYFWPCFVIAIVPGLGQAGIPVAILTWILMLFLN